MDNRSLNGDQSFIGGSARSLARFAMRPVPRIVDTVLDAQITRDVVDRVLDSALIRHATDRILAGPLIDAVGDGVAEHRVIERVVTRLNETGELQAMVAAAVSNPVSDEIAAQVIESELVDQIVARLLESEDLWFLVDEIAASPAVTAAISRQSLGLADQFAGVVRQRSGRADDRLENAVQRLLRRNGKADAAEAEQKAD